MKKNVSSVSDFDCIVLQLVRQYSLLADLFICNMFVLSAFFFYPMWPRK